MMTTIHRARLCTSQAAIPAPPINPGQDLDADSGSGSGGGASAAPADTSAQADSEFEPTGLIQPDSGTGGADMVDDVPDTHEQEILIDDELAKLRDGLAKLSVKPGAKNHLAVVSNGLASQFDKATQLAPNQEYFPVLLEHTGGFQRATSLLTKNDPNHVGELVFVIGDAEMEPIRALPVTSRTERNLVERRTQGLIGSIVAAVDTGLALKRKPNVSVYIWDELGKGPGKLSEILVDALVDVFRRTTRVKVLSQFQRDNNEKIEPETEVIRKLWHANALQYRPVGADGKPKGWSRPARAMMCQAILTGALRHIAKRRLQVAQHDHIEVKLTAVIADDGEPLSPNQKVERAHGYILDKDPTAPFLHVKHERLPLDFNAQSVIRNAINSRPTDPVVTGYAGNMPAAVEAVRDSLDPDKGSSSHSVADFGRLPLAPQHAATAGLASEALGMKDQARFNLSYLTSKVAAAAKCRGKDSKA